MGSWLFAVPLVCAFIYVAAVLMLKRAAELGAGLWHSTVVCNVLGALMFQGLLVFGGELLPWTFWWQPFLVASLALGGQTLTFYSLQRGDVSIATPVLGLKILLVAVFTTLLLSQRLAWPLWLAAGLSTGGIATLNHTGAHRPGAKTAATILSAGCAAIAFALFDVLVQKFAPNWGIGRFLPLTMGLVGVLSLPLIRFFPAPLRELPRPAFFWLLGGGALFAFQSLLLVSSIAHFGQATALNVVYSSRGVWSVLAIAILGRWFGSKEGGALTGPILRWRFAGAALMFIAILLVLTQR